MELRILKYFLTIAKEESITSAAEQLHITQPTLSRQLMELEEELGTKLFNRGGRNKKVTLTNEGLLLRKRAEEIVALVEKTKSEFENNSEIISGNIYIGSGETEAVKIIAQTAKTLQKNYPHIRYNLYSGNADDVTQRLDSGLLDFGILIEPADIEKYNFIRLPVYDSWGLLMQKDCPLSDKNSISPEDLKDLPLIVSRQSFVQNELSGWCGGDFSSFNIVATYNLIYNASVMVSQGFGYALCLDKLVNTSGNSTLCFKPLNPPLKSNLSFVWKKNQVFSNACKKFLEAIKNELLYYNN